MKKEAYGYEGYKCKWISYPGYVRAWIGWETTSHYLVHKVRHLIDENNNLIIPSLFNEIEWVSKIDFPYQEIECPIPN